MVDGLTDAIDALQEENRELRSERIDLQKKCQDLLQKNIEVRSLRI